MISRAKLWCSPIQTSSYPTPANVLSFINELPPQSMFAVIGVGPFQIPMNAMGIMLGGHVRVGMEDNIYVRQGVLARTNAELVDRVIRICREYGREIASPSEARAVLGLRKR
mgnify:CR=1 FL=1